MAAVLQITILADAAKAKKAMAETGDSANAMGKSFSGIGAAMAAGAAAGAAAIVALGVSAYNAAAESAKIGRETERVIRTTGAAAWTSADQVSALASAISDKTGVDDEAIQSGENLLLTFTQVHNEVGKGNQVFDRAAQAALDMSTALGSDMSAASIQLGKALNDPIKGLTALAKSGVSFTAAQKDQIATMVEAGDVLGAQKIILGEVEKEFGGAAEAAGTPLDKLTVKIGNFEEAAGGILIPAVDAVATALGDNMGPAVEAATGFIGDHTEAVKFLASVGLVALAAAYGPVVAEQALLVAQNVALWAAEAAAGMVSFAEKLLATAASEGVLAAASAALEVTMLPVIATVGVLGGVVYGLISVFDQSSESADAFYKAVTQDADTSSFDSLDAAAGQLDERLASLRKSVSESSWLDALASSADVLIPFHDIENSLLDQEDALATLTPQAEAYHAKLNAGKQALFDYATNATLAAAGMDTASNSSIAMDASTKGLWTQIRATNEELQAIAHQEKIDLTTPGGIAKVQALYEKTTYVTTGTLAMKEAQDKYNDATATAKDKVDAYKLALDALIGQHISAAQAETSYSQNSISLLTTLVQNRENAAGATQAQSDASLAQIVAINANNKALQDNAKGALDHATAVYQETGDLGLATAALDQHRANLIKTMEATGYSHDAAEAYANQLGLTPKNINTAVNLDNAGANAGLDTTKGKIDAIPPVIPSQVNVATAEANIGIDTTQAKLSALAGTTSGDVHLDTHQANSALDGLLGKLGEWTSGLAHGLSLGARADGGPVDRGGVYVVGERGPELFSPTRTGWIIPHQALRSSSSTAAGGTTVVNNWNITVPHAGLGVDSPRLQRDLVAAIRKHQARNGLPLLGDPVAV